MLLLSLTSQLPMDVGISLHTILTVTPSLMLVCISSNEELNLLMQHGVIGPKMYIANKDRGYGSTRLHMDVADAWNVLHCGLADWLMFRRQDADALAKFFCEQGIFVGPGHPVHAQQICVTDDMLTTLEEKTGIRPYRVRQHKGDMVFIPVRCIHQVKFPSHQELSLSSQLAGQQSEQ